MSESNSNLPLIIGGAALVIAGGTAAYVGSTIPEMKENIETHSSDIERLVCQFVTMRDKVDNISCSVESKLDDDDDIIEQMDKLNKNLARIEGKLNNIQEALKHNNIIISSHSSPKHHGYRNENIRNSNDKKSDDDDGDGDDDYNSIIRMVRKNKT